MTLKKVQQFEGTGSATESHRHTVQTTNELPREEAFMGNLKKKASMDDTIDVHTTITSMTNIMNHILYPLLTSELTLLVCKHYSPIKHTSLVHEGGIMKG